MRRLFERKRLSERFEGRFRHHVGRASGGRVGRRDAGHQHNAAVSAGAQQWCQCRAEIERTECVHTHHAVDLVWGRVGDKAPTTGYSGTVDERVDSPELRRCGGDKRCCLLRVGQVAPMHHTPSAVFGLDFFPQGLCGGLVADPGPQDVVSLRSLRERDRSADSSAGAGDDGDRAA